MALTREQLLEYALHHLEIKGEADVLRADCDIITFLFDNCTITVPEENRFFVSVNVEGILTQTYRRRIETSFSSLISENNLTSGFTHLAYTGAYDFSHTTTEWDNVIKLGIFGLRERILAYAKKNTEKKRFYENILRVYDAALRFIKRAADVAKAVGKEEMGDGLLHLTCGAPENLFEAMQTTIVYYVMQHMFDGTFLRTLGRLDGLFYSFYIKESENEAKDLLLDYFKEIDRLQAPSNIPFAICGTDVDGNSLTNALSYALLETYKKAKTNNTKLHLLCSENTPEDIVQKALDGVRNGNNSIVFMSDEKIIESLKKLGATHEDVVDYHVVGCYECGARGELTSSCNARVSLIKALEYAINGGRDILTGEIVGLENAGDFKNYEELYSEFERQLVYLCDRAMKATDLYEERYYAIHSAPILSGTYISALEKGGDLYTEYTAKYNNSSVNAIGLATTVDSLAAIKQLVFEERKMSLQAFLEILKENWKGNEPLRLYIKNRLPKFGQGDKHVDAIAKNIVNKLSESISGKPNAKGGIYRLGLFSIDWRWAFGEKAAASSDGRFAHETLSQNTSASFGMDKNGATAHLISVSEIDASNTPNGTIVDIDLHSSSVSGENGLRAMLSSLKTYFERGGFSVHYNVLDTEILKDAKKHPEKYPNLQVRLCGWNVLFSTLSEKEKDEFIARSMK